MILCILVLLRLIVLCVPPSRMLLLDVLHVLQVLQVLQVLLYTVAPCTSTRTV
jgi:hypothetical protein